MWQGPDMHHMEQSHLSTLPVAPVVAKSPAPQADDGSGGGAASEADLFGGLSVVHKSSAYEADSLI